MKIAFVEKHPERKAKMFFNQTKREYLEQGGALEDLYRNLNVSSEQEFIDKYKSMYY